MFKTLNVLLLLQLQIKSFKSFICKSFILCYAHILTWKGHSSIINDLVLMHTQLILGVSRVSSTNSKVLKILGTRSKWFDFDYDPPPLKTSRDVF